MTYKPFTPDNTHVETIVHGERPVIEINPGEWFGKRWLIVTVCGFSSACYIVEADHESDACDILAESSKSWITTVDPDDVESDAEHIMYAGDGTPYDTNNIGAIKRLTHREPRDTD